jgi:proteasome assembly chaperone 3
LTVTRNNEGIIPNLERNQWKPHRRLASILCRQDSRPSHTNGQSRLLGESQSIKSLHSKRNLKKKIQASLPSTIPLLPFQPNNQQALPAPPAAIELTPVLGSAPSEHLQTLHSLYATQIATIIWQRESESAKDIMHRRSVIVGIALRQSLVGSDEHLTENERELFLQVMSMVQELLTSAQADNE